jgi:septum formation protein
MEILRREGVAFESIESPADDPAHPPEGDPVAVSGDLARAKVRSVRQVHGDRLAQAFVIGADTICTLDGRSIGKPETQDQARDMLQAMAGRAHDVVTSVVVSHQGQERTASDIARVTLPSVEAMALPIYLASGAWRGKAGAYDIEERRRGGWSIGCQGDPDTVSGLPWRLVKRLIEEVAC